jgi:hypothetical protein
MDNGETMTPQKRTVRKVRDLNASIRAMARNLRLGLYQGRNGGGDSSYLERQRDDLMTDLPRDLQGHLTAEHDLALRVSEGRDNGQDRPELRARLTDHRRAIRDLTR